jgi:hypothetical protein
MDVLWQDNVPSFLDASSPDGTGGFAASPAEGGAPWYASIDGEPFSGQPTLWWDNGADSTTGASNLSPVGGFSPGDPVDSWIANGAETFPRSYPALENGLLWPGAGDTTPNWLLTNSGAAQFNLSAGAGTPSEWQQFFGFTSPSETWLAEAPNLLWTGGSSQFPVTSPVIEGAQSIHLAASNSLPLPTLGSLSPTQLVWAESPAAPALTAGPALAEVAATPVMSGTGAEVPSSSGLPIGGFGSHR